MKRILAFLIVLSFTFSCVPDSVVDGPGPDPIGNSDKFILMTNGNDPKLLSIKKESDTIINIYGDRDSNGIPLNITQFTIGRSQEEENIYYLDEQNRLTYMRAENGVKFFLNWKSDTLFDLTAITPDGATTINTEIDLLEDTGKTSKKLTKNTLLDSRRSKSFETKNNTGNNLIHKGQSTVSLRIIECGLTSKSPYNKPRITVKTATGGDTNSDFLSTIFPKINDNGIFVAQIPNDLAPSVNHRDMCEAMKDILDIPCKVYGSGLGVGLNIVVRGVCLALAAKITALGITAPLAAPFYTACDGLNNGLLAYCNSLGASVDQGAPSLAEKICAADLFNVSIYEDLVIFASIDGVPNNILSNVTTNPGQGPYEDLVIDLGSANCDIKLSGDLNFGTLAVGDKEEKILTITNQFSNDTEVSLGDLPAGFTANWTTGIIGAGTQREVTIFFEPEDIKPYNSTIQVSNSTDPSKKESFEITGNGIQKRFDLEADLSFGNLKVNTQSQKLLKITNNNNRVPINVTSIEFPDGYALGWTKGTIDAQSTREIIVDFLPTEAKEYAGEIKINSDADSYNNTISISGTGINSFMQLSGNLDFGEKTLNVENSRFFDIVNTSATESIEVSEMIFSVQPQNDFSIKGWNKGTIPPNATQEVEVVFKPMLEEEYMGNLTVVNNIEATQNTVQLFGKGIKNTIRLSGDLEFGEVTKDESKTLSFDIENPNLNEEITIEDILLPEGFSVDWTNGTIQASAKKTVNITFSPKDIKDYSGIVEVKNNIDDDNNKLDISGKGISNQNLLEGEWMPTWQVTTCEPKPTSNDQTCLNHQNGRAYIFIPNQNGTCQQQSCGTMDFSNIKQGNSDQVFSNKWEFDGTTLTIEIKSNSNGFFFDSRTFNFIGALDTTTNTITGTYVSEYTGGLWRNKATGTLTLVKE